MGMSMGIYFDCRAVLPTVMALFPRQWILDCIIVERVSWVLATFRLSIHPPIHCSLLLTLNVM